MPRRQNQGTTTIGGKRRGRPTRIEQRDRELARLEETTRDELRKITLELAPTALRFLGRAIGHEFSDDDEDSPPIKATPDTVRAASYIINQVMGSPGKKADPPDPAEQEADALLREIRNLRTDASYVRTVEAGSPALVEPAADAVQPEPGPGAGDL